MSDTVKDWKKEAQKQWNETPCGSTSVEASERNKEHIDYFLAVEHHRYHEYAPWMKSFFQYSRYKGKKVLEIGYGQGTDLSQFALAGAECFGVDITNQHFELATRNLRLRGLQAKLYLEDASKLHFEDNTFDVVYSFGVLHHTPDTIRCISEAYRVLKPGGELLITLYHKYSAFHLFSVLIANGIIRGRLKKLGYAGLLATIEEGADGIDIKPLVKLYSARQLRTILGDFSHVSTFIKHLDKSHFSFVGRVIPSFLLPLLEAKLGWYVIGRAIK